MPYRSRQTRQQVSQSTGVDALVFHVVGEVIYHPVEPLVVLGWGLSPTERPKGFLHKRGEGWAEEANTMDVSSIPDGHEVPMRERGNTAVVPPSVVSQLMGWMRGFALCRLGPRVGLACANEIRERSVPFFEEVLDETVGRPYDSLAPLLAESVDDGVFARIVVAP